MQHFLDYFLLLLQNMLFCAYFVFLNLMERCNEQIFLEVQRSMAIIFYVWNYLIYDAIHCQSNHVYHRSIAASRKHVKLFLNIKIFELFFGNYLNL